MDGYSIGNLEDRGVSCETEIMSPVMVATDHGEVKLQLRTVRNVIGYGNIEHIFQVGGLVGTQCRNACRALVDGDVLGCVCGKGGRSLRRGLVAGVLDGEVEA